MEYEDRRTIATPEGVQLALPLAGIGTRFMATLIDLLLGFSIAFVAVLFAGALGGRVAAAIVGAAAALSVFVVYNVVFEVFGGGRTLGHRAAGLRVVADGGSPVGLRASLIRNTIRIVEFGFGFYLPAVISILVTRNNQRLGDIAAGSLVIRETRAPVYEQPQPVIPPAQFASWDVTGVGDAELAAVRTFLERRHSLAPGTRAALAGELVEKLRPRVPGVRPGLHDEQFLEYLAAAKSGPSAPPVGGSAPPYG
ncbi:RDD family protein [Solirubrobacter sp. CPCC 204708]|uniref:RDD family protein n=1 Tax=Solirubrobacter deserti TaxID=2282478 RepID=A0ABT4RUK4_9ACTN|nr:RDD family protein [Solirubrobacter deserti]MBE2320169.1 RDD family protein [Solirubrobacter deserti]MDA0142216.1 RDD family protein [Solirubrobacter deserti]